MGPFTQALNTQFIECLCNECFFFIASVKLGVRIAILSKKRDARTGRAPSIPHDLL